MVHHDLLEEPTHDVGGHYAKVVHLLHLGSQGDCEALLRNKTLLPVPIRRPLNTVAEPDIFARAGAD